MKVLGMGNALVDIMIRLSDDSFLEKFNLPRGSMTLVDLDLSNRINLYSATLDKSKASGGSAANTIHGLARLGVDTAYIGKVGNDDLGKFFTRDLKDSGIKPVLYNSMSDTGKVMAMISPDSERTMATYLGAAVELSEDDITSDIFKDYDLFYIEGYLVNNFKLFSKAIRLAHEQGNKVALDLASFNVVDQYKDELKRELEAHVDIVFANEEEAKSLTGLNPQDALQEISQYCELAVVKIGAEGSLIKRGGEEVRIPAFPVNSIDTTGAGDSYAAGFIYGLSLDLSLEKCGRIGNLLASEIIQVIGPKVDENTWSNLKTRIDEILNS